MTYQRSTDTVLIVGAYGVVGGAVTERLCADDSWATVTAARRGPTGHLLSGRPTPDHVPVDLLDTDATTRAFAGLGKVTHVVFTAYTERDTMAATVAPNAAMLANTLSALAAAGARLRHVVLIGGGKSYGEHLGPYKTPAKESDPRFLGPIFYNDQEDLLAEAATEQGFDWTVLRPDAVLGVSIGSPMNMLHGLAVFATVSKHLDVPLRFPGSPGAWTALHQTTDADIVAQAVGWALRAPTAVNEIFNVTNGDNFRWVHLWPELAAFFDMPTAPPQPMSIIEQMADKEPVWDEIVARHDLRPTPWPAMVSWPFVQGWFNTDYDMVQSTIKIRRAGFTGCIDSHESLRNNLALLRRQRFIP